MPKLDTQSRTKLDGVHPDLIKVLERCAEISPVPFRVIEGKRTLERQRELVRKGFSQTENSRHIPADNGLAHAADVTPIVDGKISWSWPHYYKLAKAMKQAARERGVPVEWGGDWKSFKDGPHWQLPWKQYPGAAAAIAHLVPHAPRMEHDLSKSRTMTGGALSFGGGVAVMAPAAKEMIGAIQGQQAALSSGHLFTVAIGLVVVAGACYAMYARWDDAGRPNPFKGAAQ